MDAPAIGFDAATHIEDIRRDGYTIIEGILDAADLAAFRTGIGPHLDRWTGRNPFEGLRTERVYTLVGRGRIFEGLAADPRILGFPALRQPRHPDQSGRSGPEPPLR